MKLVPASTGGVALIFLSAIMVNGVLTLIGAPPAYATTCSSSGGQTGKPGYYYAEERGSDTTNAYGVGVHSIPYTWTLNTGTSNGHMDLYVNLGYSNDAYSWSQTGYGYGNLSKAIGISNSRNVYMEFAIAGRAQAGSYLFGTSIPDNDQGYLEVWTYNYDMSSGHYTARGEAYSPAWSTYYVSSQDMGIFLSSGPVETSTEAWYMNYNNPCDNYSPYSTTSGAVYTTAVWGSEPLSSGLGWGSCAPGTVNYPYNVAAVGLCNQTVQYWGG